MRRKICVITSTRADYGLLRGLMQALADDSGFELQIVATGMHLSPEFGHTYREIERDGFRIDRKIEILLSSDTAEGLSKSMGLALIGFGEALGALQPDIVLLLGDRFEILSAAAAATLARIPLAHISGGEISEGCYDDSFRHAITKMSHYHFVAAQEYYQRVVQLGESPDRVFVVGGMAVDNIKSMKLMSQNELEDSLGIKFAQKNLLITYHPVTHEDRTSAAHMDELLAALSRQESTRLIFTMPNADTDSRVIFTAIEKFLHSHPNAVAFTSLGHLRYLSCLQHVDGVIGNSSSGLSEVPSFRKGTINIGDRQRGRLKAESVIDCLPDRDSIMRAIKKLYSEEFQSSLEAVINPYGEGGAVREITRVLKNLPDVIDLKKRFHDCNRDNS